jgi:hypothetical protein
MPCGLPANCAKSIPIQQPSSGAEYFGKALMGEYSLREDDVNERGLLFTSIYVQLQNFTCVYRLNISRQSPQTLVAVFIHSQIKPC